MSPASALKKQRIANHTPKALFTPFSRLTLHMTGATEMEKNKREPGAAHFSLDIEDRMCYYSASVRKKKEPGARIQRFFESISNFNSLLYK